MKYLLSIKLHLQLRRGDFNNMQKWVSNDVACATGKLYLGLKKVLHYSAGGKKSQKNDSSVLEDAYYLLCLNAYSTSPQSVSNACYIVD